MGVQEGHMKDISQKLDSMALFITLACQNNVFDYPKTLMENNRSKIWDVKFGVDGEHAKVTMNDVGFIIFGGDYQIAPGGSFIRLDNAFALGFTKSRLESAMKKCGYVPATRAALESGKLRHELVLNKEGETDEDLNDVSMAKAILEIEKMNHDAVEKLEEKGYSLANTLKRSLKKKSPSSSVEIEQHQTTVPGTSEHQRALSKASSQGKHFKVTDGGAPMNTDDCMIAAELKEWEKERVLLEKKKESI